MPGKFNPASYDWKEVNGVPTTTMTFGQIIDLVLEADDDPTIAVTFSSDEVLVNFRLSALKQWNGDLRSELMMRSSELGEPDVPVPSSETVDEAIMRLAKSDSKFNAEQPKPDPLMSYIEDPKLGFFPPSERFDKRLQEFKKKP